MLCSIFTSNWAFGQDSHPECNARVPAISEALAKAKLTPEVVLIYSVVASC